MREAEKAKVEFLFSHLKKKIFFFSLGLPLWHMEVPRLTVKLELPLLA